MLGMAGKFAKSKKTEDEERLIRARADKVELDIALKKQDLVPVKDVESEWVSMTLSFRNKMLSLPTALAQELADEMNPKEIEVILKRSISEALTELTLAEEASVS
jgi:phage terminase Nu1 subunit (DNA packaging protein)